MSNSAHRRNKRRSLKKFGKKWCIVYGLAHPQTHEVCYIGQTRNLAQRLKFHLRHAREGRKGKIFDWTRTLLARGLLPEVKIIEDPATWDVSEIIWIERYRAAGHRLFNILRGGQDAPFKGKIPPPLTQSPE